MRALHARGLVVAALTATVFTLAGCPGGGPKLPGGPGASKVDPNTCGNYAVSDAGRKLKAFLEATVRLDTETQRLVNVVGESCAIMGRELAMTPAELEGQPKDVCARVFGRIQDNLKVGLQAGARLQVEYKPAICTVNLQASAKAAAKCEAKAEADMAVRCDGTCHGTCSGTCQGAGQAGTGGSSGGGECDGVCDGTCSGGCDGTANVEASAECRAKAEVDASLDVTCTEPELTITADAAIVVDPTKVEQTLAAMRAGLPKIFSIQARLKPLQVAVTTWAKTATDLANAGRELTQSFKDQALCISGQIKAAFDAIARINASISVSVEVSVSASASAGVN